MLHCEFRKLFAGDILRPVGSRYPDATEESDFMRSCKIIMFINFVFLKYETRPKVTESSVFNFFSGG